MAKKYDIINFALEKFSLKLVKQNSEWVEFSDGVRDLLVTKDHFIYSFRSTNEAIPVSPDIEMLAEIAREELLGVKAKYVVFGPFDKKKVSEVIEDAEY